MTEIAIQAWILTEFPVESKKALMRRCCFIHLENQSHLPTMPIKFSDGQRVQAEVVGQEDEQFVGFCIIDFYVAKFV